jgi:uncharacterized OsmC-like protein
MRIILESAESVRLAEGAAGVAVEGADDVALSPFHLLAASLAMCTWSVLQGWAGHAGIPAHGLELTVDWSFGEDPVRVSELRMDVAWPELPPQRREAARRAAAQCTVHHTLEHGTRVSTRVQPPEGW